MSVLDAVERDLELFPENVRDGVLAWSARVLAEQLDDPGNSATSKAMCNKELRDTFAQLRALSPPAREANGLDDLTRRRADRLSRATGSVGS